MKTVDSCSLKPMFNSYCYPEDGNILFSIWKLMSAKYIQDQIETFSCVYYW